MDGLSLSCRFRDWQLKNEFGKLFFSLLLWHDSEDDRVFRGLGCSDQPGN